METPGSTQQMAASIFQDMVMQEAIKDKTIQVKNQLKDKDGTLIDRDNLHEHLHGADGCSNPNHSHQPDLKHGSDDEDNWDEEEEKIMRGLRDQRVQQMKN